MRRPLTAKAVKAAAHSGKTDHVEWLADGLGHGLMLAMKPSGAKSWVQRIVVQEQEARDGPRQLRVRHARRSEGRGVRQPPNRLARRRPLRGAPPTVRPDVRGGRHARH